MRLSKARVRRGQLLLGEGDECGHSRARCHLDWSMLKSPHICDSLSGLGPVEQDEGASAASSNWLARMTGGPAMKTFACGPHWAKIHDARVLSYAPSYQSQSSHESYDVASWAEVEQRDGWPDAAADSRAVLATSDWLRSASYGMQKEQQMRDCSFELGLAERGKQREQSD